MELKEIGVTPKKEKQFNSKKIFTVEDLQCYFPSKYMEYKKVADVRHITEPGIYLLHGVIVSKRGYNGSTCRIEVLSDTGATFFVSWFSDSYEFRMLNKGWDYFFGGKVSFFNDMVTMICPEVITRDEKEALRIRPKYSPIKGMSAEYLLEKVSLALSEMKEPTDRDFLSTSFSLMKRKEALKEIHTPTDVNTLKKAKYRISADEMLDFYKELKEREYISAKSVMSIKSIEKAMDLARKLPYKLTPTQKSSLTEIKKAFINGERPNFLLMGDVGSGKTIVAIISACIAAENGYNVAILSPTQILARQTFEETKHYLEPFGIGVAYLDGDNSKKEKKEIQDKINAGEVKVLVGTHALISESIQYANLGLLIIDEEHRFGVKQKEILLKRENEGVGLISMSATPIPRSLAMSLFGANTKVLTMVPPSERQKVDTSICDDLIDTYDKIVEEVKSGHQAYIVCPLIEDSESEALEGVSSVEDIYKTLRQDLFNSGISVGMVTGAMKSEDSENIIRSFSTNEINVLVTTTVVEVGVNVPNATLMIIKNAERFGLAQLHQLRGRVGRGKAKSSCILVSDKDDAERLNVLCKTNDGFEIAEEDMRLRGPGKLNGIKQSGYSKDVELILKFPKLSAKIKEYVYSER